MNKSVLFTIIIILILGAVAVFIKTAGCDIHVSATQDDRGCICAICQLTITADGSVTAATEATLAFQTPGKLTYLPFKAGDKVYLGQTVAAIDPTALRDELSLAANAYQTTKNNVDPGSREQSGGRCGRANTEITGSF